MRSLTQSTNYFVVFGTTKLQNIKYYLQGCNIPSVFIQPQFIDNDKLRLVTTGTSLEYGELTLNILLDEDFENYTTLLDELYSYKDKESGGFEIKPFNMELMITSNKGNSFLKFSFEDCYISSLTGLEFSDIGESETMTISVTLNFNYMNYTRLL